VIPDDVKADIQTCANYVTISQLMDPDNDPVWQAATRVLAYLAAQPDALSAQRDAAWQAFLAAENGEGAAYGHALMAFLDAYRAWQGDKP